MENSRRSIAQSEDSISMYLSFDTDAEDTLASKWQSVLGSQTSQYLEVQQSIIGMDMENNNKLDETLEEQVIVEKKTLLKSFMQNDIIKEQSPLRPFDQSLLNKHNALCSTPTKNKTLVDPRQNLSAIDNKENTQPDVEENTTLENTASTVKINTMLTEPNATIDEISVQEPHNKTSNVYPLNADVLLENITEVSNEETSMTAPDKQQEQTEVVNMVNEVSELINKALKLTDAEEQPKSSLKLPTVALPRPRRSFLPTSGGQTYKQRMSIVVRTTLNSPARKLVANNPSARRSFLPTARPNPSGGAYRRSTVIRATESRCSISATASTANQDKPKPKVKARPKTADIVEETQFNCQLCRASFGDKSQLDLHMRKHMDLKKPGACKFCDKKFALERALHIHLMQNCDKIPPAEKRKLQYTELNHVKKAQLPKLPVVSCSSSSSSLKGRESTMPAIGRAASLGAFKPKTPAAVATSDTNSNAAAMPPPSLLKPPKKVAHAGVYRTPTKTVPCHICKQSFRSIIDYTTHSLTMHSKTQAKQPTD